MSTPTNPETYSTQYVSIVGASFFHSIARLSEALIRCADRKAIAYPHESAPRYYENAYCISIFVLAIASLESAIIRVRYSKDGLEFPSGNPFDWFTINYPHEKANVGELAFIRGSILHNHLYSIQQVWVDDKPTITNIQRRSSSGDGKFKRNVNPKTFKTKVLEINVIPSQIRFADVIRGLQAVAKLLLLLDKISERKLGFINT